MWALVTLNLEVKKGSETIVFGTIRRYVAYQRIEFKPEYF